MLGTQGVNETILGGKEKSHTKRILHCKEAVLSEPKARACPTPCMRAGEGGILGGFLEEVLTQALQGGSAKLWMVEGSQTGQPPEDQCI